MGRGGKMPHIGQDMGGEGHSYWASLDLFPHLLNEDNGSMDLTGLQEWGL